MSSNIYKRAARKKLRFSFKGNSGCAVEDLFDLSLAELDNGYRALNAQKKTMSEDSLLSESKVDPVLELKINIIKDVVETKQRIADAQTRRTATLEKKARILEILAHRQDEAIEKLETDELLALIDQKDEEVEDMDE